jgi:hypothetical protein
MGVPGIPRQVCKCKLLHIIGNHDVLPPVLARLGQKPRPARVSANQGTKPGFAPAPQRVIC